MKVRIQSTSRDVIIEQTLKNITMNNGYKVPTNMFNKPRFTFHLGVKVRATILSLPSTSKQEQLNRCLFIINLSSNSILVIIFKQKFKLFKITVFLRGGE